MYHVRTQPLTATGAPSQTSTIPYHTIPYHHTIPHHHTIPCHVGRRDSGAGYLRYMVWYGMVDGIYYPASAWLIQLRAYAMPSVPVPPITLLTEMVARCRLLAAHGAKRSGLYHTWYGMVWYTSTIPYVGIIFFLRSLYPKFTWVGLSSVRSVLIFVDTLRSVQAPVVGLRSSVQSFFFWLVLRPWTFVTRPCCCLFFFLVCFIGHANGSLT